MTTVRQVSSRSLAAFTHLGMGSYFVKILSLTLCPFFCISPTTERADSGNANAGVFGHFQVFSIRVRKSGLWYLLGPLYMDFDQNQELVHFGKLTPSHNGRIPKMQMPVFLSTFMFSASGRGRARGLLS